MQKNMDVTLLAAFVPSKKDLNNGEENLFNSWLNFTDADLELKFRAFSFNECRKKMLSILSLATYVLIIASLVSLAYYLAGYSAMLWDLEIRLSTTALLVLMWFYCQCSWWQPWHFHIVVVAIVFATLERMTHDNPYFIMMAPMGRAITCTASMHNALLVVIFSTMDITLLVIGGHFIRPDLPFNVIFITPFFLVYIAGLYLQFYVERTDRERWHSELCYQEKVVAEAKARAETDTMLRFISHEVRNPQNAIALSADSLLMEAREQPETFRADHIRVLETIQSNSECVTVLLEDILNFSRLSDGKIVLSMQPFCPMEFLTSLAHSQSVVLGSKNLVFLTELDPRLAQFFCCGDKHRIQQVLTNFVSNAAKFTKSGGVVKMTAILCQEDDVVQPPALESHVRIRFAVKDSGIGISAVDQKLLFQSFSQINPGKNQGGKGMGLGLNISKGLVELHAGVIGVNSIEGQGAEFYCEIPFCVVSDPARELESVQNYIESSATTTNTAYNASNTEPNQVVSRSRIDVADHFTIYGNELQMYTPTAMRAPPCDADKIATDKKFELEEVVVELTSLVVPVAIVVSENDTVLAYNSVGVSGSVGISATDGMIQPPSAVCRRSPTSGNADHLTERMAASQSGRSLSSKKPHRVERILVADDSQFARDILERALTQLGFDCVMVASGEEAITQVSANMFLFALIFLDMNMGGITGVETTLVLRRLGCTGNIIGLTGDDTPECRAQFLNAKADRVLTKPLRLTKLNEVLLEIMPPLTPLISPESLSAMLLATPPPPSIAMAPLSRMKSQPIPNVDNLRTSGSIASVMHRLGGRGHRTTSSVSFNNSLGGALSIRVSTPVLGGVQTQNTPVGQSASVLRGGRETISAIASVECDIEAMQLE